MKRLSLRRTLRLLSAGLFIVASKAAVWGRNLAQESPRVGVSVFNQSGSSSEIIVRAEQVSSHVFGEGGIYVDWVNCSPGDEAPSGKAACRQAIPQRLHLHIVQRSLNLRDSTLGISYLASDGAGFQADIFYEGIEKLGHETSVDPATILGHTAAHEIGHLLLGTNSHSPEGIMRAHWNPEELARANKGSLLFTKSQSHRMAEKLRVAMARTEWPSASSNTQLSAENCLAATILDFCCRLSPFISAISSREQLFLGLLGCHNRVAPRGDYGREADEISVSAESRSIGRGETSEP